MWVGASGGFCVVLMLKDLPGVRAPFTSCMAPSMCFWDGQHSRKNIIKLICQYNFYDLMAEI